MCIVLLLSMKVVSVYIVNFIPSRSLLSHKFSPRREVRSLKIDQ